MHIHHLPLTTNHRDTCMSLVYPALLNRAKDAKKKRTIDNSSMHFLHILADLHTYLVGWYPRLLLPAAISALRSMHGDCWVRSTYVHDLRHLISEASFSNHARDVKPPLNSVSGMVGMIHSDGGKLGMDADGDFRLLLHQFQPLARCRTSRCRAEK